MRGGLRGELDKVEGEGVFGGKVFSRGYPGFGFEVPDEMGLVVVTEFVGECGNVFGIGLLQGF